MARRGLVIVVAVLLIGLAVAGTAFGRGVDEEMVAPEPQFVDGRFEPPITITTPMSVHDPDNWPDGQSFADNPFIWWVERELGIRIEPSYYFPDHDTNVERLMLAAAADDMPDVIYAPDQDIARLAREGASMPLDDIFEQYASPLTEYLIEVAQESVGGTLFYPTTVDGQFYGAPHSPENVWEKNWIRSDLLEEFGLDMPETLDDLEVAPEAYHEAYPEGRAFAMANDLHAASMVFHAMGAYPEMWVERNGELEYGSIQPETRDALARLAEWYENGWIDSEFVVHDFGPAVLEPAAAGNLFANHGAWWFIWWPWVGMWENNPEAQIMPFPPLERPDGERVAVLSSPFYGWSTGIRAGFEYPEALIYLLNEKVDSYHRNNLELREIMAERGYEFKYPVTEVQEPLNPEAEQPFLYQYDYEMPGWGFFNELGETHFNRAVGFFTYSLPDRLFRRDGMFQRIYHAYQEGTIDQLRAEDRAEFRNLSDIERRLETHLRSVEIVMDLQERDAIEYDRFLGAPTPSMAEHDAYLTRIEEETFVGIIMGDRSIEAFDRFVDQWLDGGGAAISEEVNEWFIGLEQ